MFLRRSRLTPSEFGARATGDRKSWATCAGLGTADRVLASTAAWNRDHEPDGLGIRHQRRRYETMTSVIERETALQVRILRLPEVLARTGLSRSTIYVRLDQGRFPRPVSLGARAVGWIEAEVDEWIRDRIAASRDGAE